MNNVSFFKTLNEDMIADIGYQETPLELFFNKNGEKIEFETPVVNEGATKEVQLQDNSHSFDFTRDDIHYRKKITIQNHSYLFGEEGLVPPDGELGLAVKYYSKESQQQYTKILKKFDLGSAPIIDEPIAFNIPGGYFRKSIVLELLLFAVTPIVKELPHTKGTVLGTLESTKYLLEGEGGTFPILHHEEPVGPGDPLWWVECNWEDAAIDLLHEDYVSLNINRKHPDAKDLKLEAMPRVSPMMKQIISSAILNIAFKVLDEYNIAQLKNDENFEEGSVASAVSYFLDNMQEDVSSPELLSKAIQKSVNERFEES